MGKADTRLNSQAMRLLKSGFFCYQLNGKYPVETLQSSINFFLLQTIKSKFQSINGRLQNTANHFRNRDPHSDNERHIGEKDIHRQDKIKRIAS
jgi:hypothetical protein